MSPPSRSRRRTSSGLTGTGTVILGAVVWFRLSGADEETGEGSGDEVEERPHRPIVPGLYERESGFPTLTPWIRRLDQPVQP